MKSALDMIKDVFDQLNVDSVRSIISGNIYMLERPQNSILNDIAINSLPITNDQQQKGIVNVNIHCQNLQNVVIGGKVDNTIPDITNLNRTSKAVLAILNSINATDFRLQASTSGQPIKDNDNSFYINIRVNYYSIQPNYVNI